MGPTIVFDMISSMATIRLLLPFFGCRKILNVSIMQRMKSTAPAGQDASENRKTSAEILRQNPLRFVCSWRGSTSGYFPFHSHPAIELVYHPGGSGVTSLETGRQIAFAPYSIVIYPAWLRHDQRMATPGIDICLHIELPQASAEIQDLFSRPYYIPLLRPGTNRADRFVRSEFLQLAQVRNHPARQVELDLRATALMARLLQLGRIAGRESSQSAAEIYMDRAQHYIRENYASIASIREVAKHVGVSEDYLRHLFSERGGESPSKLLNQAKIARAKELLIHSSLPLKGIASQCGFQTERYLSTRFKKLGGCSPGAFRRQYGHGD